MTANRAYIRSRSNGQRSRSHSVCNRQRRLTAKSVRISCLFNVEKWRGATCPAWLVARRNFPKRPKTQYFRTKKTQNPQNADNTPDRLARSRVAFELQCFRNCTLSSFYRAAYMQGGLRDGKRVRPFVCPSVMQTHAP